MVTCRYRCGVVALLVAMLVLGGCSGNSSVGSSQLNSFDRSSVSFFEPVRYGASALEAEHYKTLTGATRAASAVVIAEVTDVWKGSVSIGETSKDKVRRIAIDIHPVATIKGSLTDDHQEKVTVERLAGGDVEQSIEHMRATLPDGLSVWFLRNLADYTRRMKGRPPTAEEKRGPTYRLVSSQGLFVQGKDRVIDPAGPRARWNGGPGPVVRKAGCPRG